MPVRLYRTIPVFLLLLAVTQGCNLYYVRIAPGAQKVDTRTRLPVIRLVLREDGINHDSKHASLDSGRLKTRLQQIRFLEFESDARLQMRYSIRQEPTRTPGLANVLWCISMGIYPLREETETTVRFDLFDRLEKRVVRSYVYNLKHISFFGWIPLASSPLTAASSVTGIAEDISVEAEALKTEEKIVSRLSNDLLVDSGDPLLGRLFASSEKVESPAVAVLPFTGDEQARVSSRIEARLLQRKIRLVERKDAEVRAILKSQAFEQGGLIQNPSELGRFLRAAVLVSGNVEKAGQLFRVSIVVHDAESGEILFKDTFTTGATDSIPNEVVDRIAARVEPL